MKQFYLLAFFLCGLSLISAQDTLSFGGIYELPGAEVRAQYTPVSPLAQRFTIEEVYRLPGTFYDPARLVALLPGVVQTNDQANHLSVRGNTPNANLWRINGLAIVNPNHTANAGTFYDFPTLSGGGVNAISAQMLDNSGFLAGGLPVEYGHATGGTFDLRLRPGSKTKRRYQLQAGFIGFDGMAEGPIGSSGQTSYLVNGRYSFTGLLADMGVDFGGEEIRFADFNAHLHHQWDGGEVSAFAILGQSSNVFRGPDSTETDITEQKELFDIDFESDVFIRGTNFSQRVGKGRLSGGFSTSSTESNRVQQSSPFTQILRTRSNSEARYTNANLQYLREYDSGRSIKFGAEFIDQFGRVDFGLADGGGGGIGMSTTAISPFISYGYRSKKVELDLGMRVSNYLDLPEKTLVEPRFQIKRRWKKQVIEFLAEYNSSTRPVMQHLSLFNFDPILNGQTSLKYVRKIKGLTIGLTGYFQSTPKDQGIEVDGFILAANDFNEIDLNYTWSTIVEVATRRYGLELEVGGGDKNNGVYYRGNISTFKSETKQRNEEWTSGRYDFGFAGNLTSGREWKRVDKKNRETVLGVNISLILHGGERYGRIVGPDDPNRAQRFFQPQNFADGFLNSTGPYFRPDLRLYKTKTRAKTTTTLALDIQNVAGVQNVGNVYYDAFLERPNERLQLGLIPVLSYRILWR